MLSEISASKVESEIRLLSHTSMNRGLRRSARAKLTDHEEAIRGNEVGDGAVVTAISLLDRAHRRVAISSEFLSGQARLIFRLDLPAEAVADKLPELQLPGGAA